MVPKRGLEPLRSFDRYHLKVVRLPIPPPGQSCVFRKKRKTTVRGSRTPLHRHAPVDSNHLLQELLGTTNGHDGFLFFLPAIVNQTTAALLLLCVFVVLDSPSSGAYATHTEKLKHGAQGGTRTLTLFRAPTPEAGASTNSATWAKLLPTAVLRVAVSMVPRGGLEPPRPCERQHLKLVRLPIPPSGQNFFYRLLVTWCATGESNPHTLRRQNLNLVRLPIPPIAHNCFRWCSQSCCEEVVPGAGFEPARPRAGGF